jgi:hypothetical protein
MQLTHIFSKNNFILQRIDSARERGLSGIDIYEDDADPYSRIVEFHVDDRRKARR